MQIYTIHTPSAWGDVTSGTGHKQLKELNDILFNKNDGLTLQKYIVCDWYLWSQQEFILIGFMQSIN